jgi:carboxymethylenebutenolidase
VRLAGAPPLRPRTAAPDYEFHRYDGASYGFFYYFAPAYRPEVAMDGWEKVFAFFGTHLS